MNSTLDSKDINDTNSEGEISFSPSLYAGEAKIDHESLWRKIHDAVISIIEKRFSEPAKRKAKIHADRIAFACPYCGDSATDTGKKRGNLFTDSMNYHCFNGDCSSHMSLFFFLKDQGELERFTPEEIAHIKFRVGEASANHVTKKIRVYQSVESLMSEEAMNLTVSRDFFMKKMKLQEIRGSRMDRYLKQRLQTDFHRFGFDPKKGLLYLFNLTKDDTRILGYQVKTFNKRNSYLTYKTSQMHKELKIFREENAELLAKMDTIASCFGILKIDLNKTVTVFEGPMDSFLFPNAVGVCSAKNDFPFEIDSIRYFYDNDPTGKEWAMTRLLAQKPVFLWKKYIAENELSAYESKIKDLNDLLIEVHRKHLKLKKFADYFSEDKYDAVWI
jgi:hypothetical protein